MFTDEFEEITMPHITNKDWDIVRDPKYDRLLNPDVERAMRNKGIKSGELGFGAGVLSSLPLTYAARGAIKKLPPNKRSMLPLILASTLGTLGHNVGKRIGKYQALSDYVKEKKRLIKE